MQDFTAPLKRVGEWIGSGCAAFADGVASLFTPCGPQHLDRIEHLYVAAKHAPEGAVNAIGQTHTRVVATTPLQHIELLGEVLQVFKDKLEHGEIAVRKELVTETQLIEVPVTREELVIERKGAGGRPSRIELFNGQREIRIPLWEERVRIDKRPVVREVVNVTRRQIEDVERLSDVVRQEQLRVSTEGNAEVCDDQGSTDQAA